MHVSLVNWVNEPEADPTEFNLNGRPAGSINASLGDADPNAWTPQSLPQNRGRCFEGPSPKAKGLIINEVVAARLLRADPANADVVRLYLTASDITDSPSQSPSRWTIDFGLRPLEKCLN